VERVVVVGAGIAGLQTVVALRAQGYSGHLTLVGGEPHAPYDRPPLSKAIMRGHSSDSTLEADWPALAVELRLGVQAVALEPGVLETTAGRLDHDALVVATGALPVRLPGADSALVLRTIEHARALRARLEQRARLVIVGAGWIGAEVATAAAEAGRVVTVVEALDSPLAGALPPEVGGLTARWYADAGVDLRLGTRVDAVEPDAVQLAGGERIPADVVLVGVGVRPATDWLAGSGVELAANGAVTVDAGLRTGRPGVFAVGDAAAWRSERYRTLMHVEHWDCALHAPTVVAANLLGGDERYDPVPYFWSEQFDRYVQYAGHHPAAQRLVFRGDPDLDAAWAAFWLDGDRLVAALTVDRPRDLVQARRLMAADATVAVDRLTDPTTPVKVAAVG
jgi:NADPH-dependent 2,4-dienoyl-CoA reductase/sulfur reductase-like enzyme